MPERNDNDDVIAAVRGTDAGAISRRTMVRAAAWSIPVMALAVAAPAAAASEPNGIRFTAPSYSGVACQPVTPPVVVELTYAGPITDQAVTVTLANGYTFAGGAVEFTGSTSAGLLALPNVIAPSMGGESTFTATSQGLSPAVAPVVAPVPTVTAFLRSDSAVVASYPGTPADAVAVGAGYFLYNNGDLYFGTTHLKPGVKFSSVDTLNNGTNNYAGAIDTSGIHYTFTNGGNPAGVFVGVGATALGAAYSLTAETTNKRLFYGGTQLRADVVSADSINNSGANFAGVITTAGQFLQYQDAALFPSWTPKSIAAGSVRQAVGAHYWLVDGALWYFGTLASTSGTAVAGATGITSFDAHSNFNTSNIHWVGAISGSNHIMIQNGALSGASTNVGAGATAVGVPFSFIKSDGRLLDANGTEVVVGGGRYSSAAGIRNAGTGANFVSAVPLPPAC